MSPNLSLTKPNSNDVLPQLKSSPKKTMIGFDTMVEKETKKIDEFAHLKSVSGIFPEWLLKRHDFMNSLYIQGDNKKALIPKIVLKALSARTENERYQLSSWLQSLDFLKHYDFFCIINFGIKLEPLYFKAGDKITRTKYMCDPICILYEGEAECLETNKIIKPTRLLWNVEADMDSYDKNYEFRLKKQSILFRVNRNDYEAIMKNF